MAQAQLSSEEIASLLETELRELLSLCSAPADGAAADTELVAPGSPWEFVKEQDGVKIYRRRSESSPVFYMKGVTVIAKKPEDVARLVWETNNRKKFDELFISADEVQHINDTPPTAIEHTCFKAPNIMISNRDFCSARSLREIEDGIWAICARAVTHPNCPEQKGFVRGELKTSGYVLRPMDGGAKTYAQYVVCVDPHGSIPTFVVNLVGTKQPLSLGKLRHFIESEQQQQQQ